MTPSPFDDDDINYAIRKTSEDKLTYKNIIADAINWCRRARGTVYFKSAVQGLESVINFNVIGYKLKDELKTIKDTLDKEKTENEIKEHYKMGRRFMKRAIRVKFKLQQEKWYWNAYFEKIIQLLGNNNLLLETQKKIPVIRDNIDVPTERKETEEKDAE